MKSIPIESIGVNIAVVRLLSGSWEFLMLKRAGPKMYAGKWSFVSGTREEGESTVQTILRELHEETGLIPESLWRAEFLTQFYEPTRDAIWITPLFVAVVPSEDIVAIDKENSEFRWLGVSEAKAIADWRNIREALDILAEELANFPSPNWIAMKF